MVRVARSLSDGAGGEPCDAEGDRMEVDVDRRHPGPPEAVLEKRAVRHGRAWFGFRGLGFSV